MKQQHNTPDNGRIVARVFYTTLAACFDMAMRQTVLSERAAKRKGKK